MKATEMEQQLYTVGANILSSTTNFLSTGVGKGLGIMTFFASLGLTTIAPLILITLIFVLIDMLFGLSVTIKLKGIKHILSVRLRDSLVKSLFYLIIIIGLFYIETNIIDGYALTSKVAFAIICGTELWSIIANMLILLPNIPALRLLKKYLEKEISSKSGQKIEEVNDILNDGE